MPGRISRTPLGGVALILSPAQVDEAVGAVAIVKAQIFTRHFVGGIAGFDVRPAHPIGGAEVYVAALARILHNAGFDVEVLAGGDDAGTSDLGYCRVRVFPLPRRWTAATFPLVLGRLV